jgi:septal ring factor EnvC (AmiA/AmiB activator)
MISPTSVGSSLLRAGVPVSVALAGILAVPATASSPGQLQQRINAARAHEGSLHSQIHNDSAQIAGFQGRIDDLEQRLAGLESSLAIERRLLEVAQGDLRDARARLVRLKARFAVDRRTLAAQLVAEYQADRPDLVTVVMDANGFADLLERMDSMRTVQRRNTEVTGAVRRSKAAVTVQAKRLAGIEARRRQITGATYVQTQEVSSLRSTLVSRQLQFVSARAQKTNELVSVRSRRQTLENNLSKIEAQAASAAAGAVPAGSFSGASGVYGFFPAPGTNYSVGSEPEIASRLDQLGKALKLHLIGISGYRSPQHSVEVGGFANDPHTHGAASDTPGIEGVPEATLNRFGLTRPFPGAAEADHIQLA